MIASRATCPSSLPQSRAHKVQHHAKFRASSRRSRRRRIQECLTDLQHLEALTTSDGRGDIYNSFAMLAAMPCGRGFINIFAVRRGRAAQGLPGRRLQARGEFSAGSIDASARGEETLISYDKSPRRSRLNEMARRVRVLAPPTPPNVSKRLAAASTSHLRWARARATLLSSLKKLGAEIGSMAARAGRRHAHPAFANCARRSRLYDMQMEHRDDDVRTRGGRQACRSSSENCR